MEYRCSMMYDEYPDKLQLKMMHNRICKNIEKQEKEIEKPELISDLVEVMLYQEMYKRRCDNRRTHRRFY